MEKYKNGTEVCEARRVTLGNPPYKEYKELKTKCVKCQTTLSFIYDPAKKESQAVCPGCEFVNVFTFAVEG